MHSPVLLLAACDLVPVAPTATCDPGARPDQQVVIDAPRPILYQRSKGAPSAVDPASCGA
jgi:hypothetical protein